MMKKTKTILTCLFLGFCSIALAQNIQVTGKVTDAVDGQPLPGATILVQGERTAFITDNDGNYTLTCDRQAVLVFSYVGYVSVEVSVNDRSLINVEMRAANVLDEVIVTALGITRERKSIGAAIQDVKAEEITKAGHLNISSALSGRVAGMQVTQAGGAIGASSRIVVRGNSSLSGNEPMIVVDGIPIANDNYMVGAVDYGSGLYDINPEDIENISVLKGGSAALYGMRAGNGVILITTKSGKAAREGLSVTYNGSVTVDNVYNLPPLQNLYGQGYEGAEYEFNNSGYNGTYSDWVYNVLGYNDLSGYFGADESWGPRLDIGLNIPQWDSPYNNGVHQATPWISHPDNIKSFFQTGYSQSHNISVVTKTNRASTRASLGFRDQKGTLPNTDQKRISAQMSTNVDINKYLSFDLAMNYTRTQSNNLPQGAYNAGNPLQSLLQWFGRQVNMESLKNLYDKGNDPYTGKPYSWCPDYHQNPYYTMYYNTNSFERNRFFGKTSLWIKPTSWLKFEGRVGYDYYDTYTKQVVLYHTDYPDGGFWSYNRKNAELNADFLAYFNKTFGDNVFSVNAVLGANYRDLNYQTSSLTAAALIVPGLFTISNVAGSPGTSMGGSHIRENSVYANLSLGFKGMLYIDASVRNDWSSTIADPFFYPSVSGSWIITETLPFLKGSLLEFLKLRGGWAQIGAATSAYQTDRYYSSAGYNIHGAGQFYNPTTYPPAGLRPESVETAEIGLEARFFENRLGFDVALYNKNTTDQILSVDVSRATGYSAMKINAGEINNKGIEIQLTATPVRTSDFTWNITLNWAKDQSKIISLYEDEVTQQLIETYNIGSSWSVYTQARVGEPWGAIYGTGSVTDDDGNIIVAANGRAKREAKVLGNVNPDWTAGLHMDLRWKNLSAGVMFDFRKGGDVFSVSQMFGSYTGIYDYTAANGVRENGVIFGKDILTDRKFVKEDGSVNDIVVAPTSAFSDFYSNRSYSVFDGSYFKLKDFYITYTIPASKFTRSSLIKAFNVSIVGSNVAILWLHKSNIAKVDPESSVNSGNSGVGIESNSFMPTRSIGLKVGLTF
ncbi:MAG: SusC/RagA family TonB-linked outer membrane protein [Bacteroidales bacterium]|nr:SusC/RagA family TonB-linked outer membrane protein [Bacteroidales bacterium]